MLASVVAVQLGSLTELKTYVDSAAQGMHSGGGKPAATSGSSQTRSAPSVSSLPAGQAHSSSRSATVPAQVGRPRARRDLQTHHDPAVVVIVTRSRALWMSALAFAPCPANVWSDSPLAASDAGDVTADTPAALEALECMVYPLFCVNVQWMAAGDGVGSMETYLERSWTCLDWAAVRDTYAQYASGAGRF